MWLIRSIIILIGVIAFLWVGMNNADQKVHFKFFTENFEQLSLNLLLLIVFAAGMIFSFLISIINEFQLRTNLSKQRRKCQKLSEEIADLRNLPLDDGEEDDRNNKMSNVDF